MIAPCKTCKERKVGCHSVCERYAEYREIVDRLGKQRKEAVLVIDYITDRANALVKSRHFKEKGKK